MYVCMHTPISAFSEMKTVKLACSNVGVQSLTSVMVIWTDVDADCGTRPPSVATTTML